MLQEIEQNILESSTTDRLNYQNKLMSSRNAGLLGEHLKRLRNIPAIPKTKYFDEISENTPQKIVNLLNDYYQSVYSPGNQNIHGGCSTGNLLTNFSVSVTKIKARLENLDVSKARGPDGIPPVFFKQLAAPLSVTLHLFFKTLSV